MGKKQHFVPQFYLRRFSFENNEKEIGLFNTDNGLFIPRTPLKSQAYEPYLYGKDGMEEALSKIESQTNPLLNKIIKEGYLPANFSNDHETLLIFLASLDLRNPIQGENAEKSLFEVYKMIAPDHIKAYMDDYELKINNIMPYVLEHGIVSCTTYAKDLDYKIIENKTSVPFIISDFPVVKYNQYFEKRKWNIGNKGYLSMGLQIFLPISPWKMVIFFDKWAYKIGSNKSKTLTVLNESDIDQLNLLQILNCQSTIYFNEKISEDLATELFIESKKYRKGNNPIVKNLDDIRVDGKKSDSLTAFHTTSNMNAKLKLSFIKETSQAKSYFNGTKPAPIRKFWWGKEMEIEAISGSDRIRKRLPPDAVQY